MLLWIQQEPVKGGVLFVVSPSHLSHTPSQYVSTPYQHCQSPIEISCSFGGLLIMRGLTQVADTAAVTIMFPGAIFAMAGGAIFGVPLGCALVWVGTTVGQTLAFIVGRCCHNAPKP